MSCDARGCCRFCSRKHIVLVFGSDEAAHMLLQESNVKLAVSAIMTLSNDDSTNLTWFIVMLPVIFNAFVRIFYKLSSSYNYHISRYNYLNVPQSHKKTELLYRMNVLVSSGCI